VPPNDPIPGTAHHRRASHPFPNSHRVDLVGSSFKKLVESGTAPFEERFSELFPTGRIDGYDLVQQASSIAGSGGIAQELAHDQP
jgi:hypothetical protein